MNKFWIFTILFLCNALIFGQSAKFGFVAWDDGPHIYQNPNLNPPSIDHLSELWKKPYKQLYIPLTYTAWSILSFLGYATSKSGESVQLNPALFHTINIAFHFLNSCLVFVLIGLILRLSNPLNTQRSTSSRFDIFTISSCMGTLVFLLHPIQTESVVWASGLRDLLSYFFILLSTYHYLAFLAVYELKHVKRTRDKYHDWIVKLSFIVDSYRWNSYQKHHILAALFFLFATLAKPSAVCGVLVAIVLGCWLFRSSIVKQTIFLLPWLVISGCITLLTQAIQTQTLYSTIPWIYRPIVAVYAVSFYLTKIFLPYSFCVDYGRSPEFFREFPWHLLLSIIGALLGSIAWIIRKRLSWVGWSFAVFIAGLSPTLSLVPFIFQRFSIVADRYAYASMLGVSIATAFVFFNFRNRVVHRSIPLVLTLVSIITLHQSDYWSSTEKLFLHTLVVNPKSHPAYNNLGLYYQGLGRHETAITYFQKAIELNPLALESGYNCGASLITLKHYKEALDHYEKMLERSLKYYDERYIYGIHDHIALSNEYLNNIDQASLHFKKAVELKPDSPDGHFNLGAFYERRGLKNEAIFQFTEALKYDPNFAEAKSHLNELSAR